VDLAARQFERILIIKPSSLGDVIHALPVLRGLRRRFPAASIDWLIGSAFAPLLADHPDLTEIVLFDRRRLGRMGVSPRIASEFVAFLRDLRARRYDLVIDLQGLFRSGFITRATGSPVRIGFRNAREGARLFYTHRIDTPTGDIHAVDKNYLVAGILGFADVPISFDLPISVAAEAEADALLGVTSPPPRGGPRGGEDVRSRASSFPSAIAGAQSTIVFAPGARWETKRWLPERFAQLIDELASDGAAETYRCVLVGGREDQELCADISRRCLRAPLNLCGRTSLPGLVAIIARADLVICHDSGASHIAAALNRPLVCITGPTNPRRTGPYGRQHDVLRLDLECSPCYFRRLSQCPHHHRCMQDLDVAKVVAAAIGNIKRPKHQNMAAMRLAD
jgi:lipopolysaccharide heptosyltransferase I